MFSDVSFHVLYKIANAPIQEFPYPHILVRDVFPPDFYREIRAHLPPRDAFKTLTALKRVTAGYSDARLVLPLAPDLLEAVAEPYRSFHGVEPITEAEVRRDLLLYDIKVENPPELSQRETVAPITAAPPARFSF